MSSCCDQTNCEVPCCNFFPEFKKSLEGLAWSRIIQMLIKLKHQNYQEYIKFLIRINILKDKNNIKFYVSLLGFYKKRHCFKEGVYSYLSRCTDIKCLNPHSTLLNCYDERVFTAITLSELLKVIYENSIDHIRFGISNIFERDSNYTLHDTRCPKHYNVQLLSCNKTYVNGLGKYIHNFDCALSHLNK